MTFSPSPQQQAVFDFVSHGSGSAVVVAVAGAGKTTTLVQALGRAKGTVTFTAFNKKIADEIKARVDEAYPGENRFRIGTFHSLGFGMLRKVIPNAKVDENARRDQLFTTAKLLPDHPYRDVAYRLYDLGRQHGSVALWPVSAPDWYEIWKHFSLDEELPDNSEASDVIALAQVLTSLAAKQTNVIDYTDMLWLPLVWKLRPWQTDWIFVDEAQDTNPCRRALARLMVKHNGRAIFVGDPCQAIFGFTGADSDAIETIKQEFNACELPLTITYRCPKAVVAVARQWVSHITAAETAPEGHAISMSETLYDTIGANQVTKPWSDMLVPGDVVLCRNTKPLVETAFRLIRQGKPAHVEGRDIGRGLLSLTNKWSVKDTEPFLDRLDEWKDKQVAKLTAKGQGLAVQSLEDRVETLRILCDGCETLTQVRTKINGIFQDTENGQNKTRITLSTIHKAKGREWETVYWYGSSKFQPSPYARQAWELTQEDNLCYVAATRAKNELVRVS